MKKTVWNAHYHPDYVCTYSFRIEAAVEASYKVSEKPTTTFEVDLHRDLETGERYYTNVSIKMRYSSGCILHYPLATISLSFLSNNIIRLQQDIEREVGKVIFRDMTEEELDAFNPRHSYEDVYQHDKDDDKT